MRTHAYARPYCVFASAYAQAYAYNSCADVRTYARVNIHIYIYIYIFFFSNEGIKYNVCSLASILLYNIINVDKLVSV